MQVVFGTKRLGGAAPRKVNVKHPNMSVVTVEGAKESGKSRRLLFNKKAYEAIKFEDKFVQEAMFGFVEVNGGTNRLFIVNTTENPVDGGDDLEIYKTSKNRVSYDSGEKGKAITSGYLCNEISKFLGLEGKETEFVLLPTSEVGMDAFELIALEEGLQDTVEEKEELVIQEQALETTNSSPEEVVEAVEDKVDEDALKAESEELIIRRSVTVE